MGSAAYCPATSIALRARILNRLRSHWPVEKLGRPFWVFFAAAFFFDFGFDLYFFLFNLFLLNLHYDERIMGIISGALTLGNVAGTIPVSIFARRYGLQRMLLFCFIAAPIVSIARIAILWMPAQIALAFLTGAALSSWPVCFAPTVAKVTTEENRVFAFSITFATGIGTGTLAGLAGGYIPHMFHAAHGADRVTDGMRFVLIGASIIAMLGVWPISRLRIGASQAPQSRRLFVFNPFLLRFLPAFALWSIVTGSFIPFASVFFHKQLGISLQHVGMIFSASELVQFCAVLLIPLLYRRTGRIGGILVAQVVTAVAVFAVGCSHAPGMVIACFLLFAAAQFSAGPGFYGLLMSRIPEQDRSSASAMQNITGALSQAGASAVTGMLIVSRGYSLVFTGSAVLALLAAFLVFAFLVPSAAKEVGADSSCSARTDDSLA